MRDNKAKPLLLLVVILISFICFGCSKNQNGEQTLEQNEGNDIVSEIETDFNNIILNEKEVETIKNAYCEAKKDWYLGLGISMHNFEILHCLGKYDNKFFVIIQGDRAAEVEIPERSQFYFIYCKTLGRILVFNYLPEPISVIYQGVYYTLQEACDLLIISDSELIDIYNNFSKIKN